MFQNSYEFFSDDVTRDSKEMKLYKPSRKSEVEKSNRPDGEVVHKTKKYENIYNKLFRKFEYNRVLTISLSANIRFITLLTRVPPSLVCKDSGRTK